MKKGRSGVDYIPVETRVSVYFDQDHICCQFCPFFETYSRKQCRLTGEYIVNEFARGYWCRLELEGLYDDQRETDSDSGRTESAEG
jgi:hypothetical protein|nr:MAG TPA: hypothetical protein [Caudoviricetes sp.]DAG67075.1 MAG TPA: hypothetical protein [Caudoviricetes sp.]DAH42015.1 MAG TPA: hypothetical protein [Caudoviricetes sp.]DAI42255.1 MAG TPA: hypothetical protein [Caudoviricetes sp.]DAI82808.1 MAG TPA: hypothetical protein [Caudoviricetes sp.]